jgi:tetratricopeptide (TPR) repeat protein
MILRLLLLAILLGTATAADAQSAPVKASRSSKKMTTIARAAGLRKNDPAEAIRLLNSVIQEQPTADELKEAFLLLGDIYADIGQGELALGRYDRALEVMSSQDVTGRAEVLLRRGTVQLSLADFDGARGSFGQCLTLAPENGSPSIGCREGLADLEARSDNFVESQNYYQQVQTAAPDSITQVRVNAKRADVYLQQNDISNAANSLDQALTQVPWNRQLSKEESKDLIAANSNVRSAVLKDAPTLDNNIVQAFHYEPL